MSDVPSTFQCIQARLSLESTSEDPLSYALISALKMLAHRWQDLTDEPHTIDKVLRKLTKESASTLLEQFGIGPV